jgi:hypothetical protein
MEPEGTRDLREYELLMDPELQEYLRQRMASTSPSRPIDEFLSRLEDSE